MKLSYGKKFHNLLKYVWNKNEKLLIENKSHWKYWHNAAKDNITALNELR